MPEIKEGSFRLDQGLVKLGAKLSEDDRRCAWELYTEIVPRVAVIGKRHDPTCEDFSGELYAESLDSLYNFFKECRGIMRKFPVGKLWAFVELFCYSVIAFNRTSSWLIHVFCSAVSLFSTTSGRKISSALW